MSMKKYFWSTLLVLLTFGSCGGPRGGPAAGGEKKATVFAVQVLTVAQGDLDNYIRVNGEVRSGTTVDVLPDVGGRLNRLNVSLGARVSRDQILGTVDPSRPGLEYVASPVRAPISGTVVALPFSVGATVSPQTPIARLSQSGDLEIVTNVAERYVAQMRAGLRIQSKFEAFPGKTFEGRVVSYSPVIDTLSRTLEVKIRLDGNTESIRSGMFAEIRIVTDTRRNVIRIPNEAIVSRFGDDFVFIVRSEGSAEKRLIKKGLEVDNFAEIVEGLSAGDKIVIRGQTLLEEGSLVRIVGGNEEETP